MSEQVESHILKKYTLIKKLGSGAYGHVWKVTDKKTNQILALKKIFDAFQHSTDAQRTFRQIVFLHELNHPNIIKLHNVFRAENDKDLYLIFEFMEADLHNAIGQKILKDIHNRFIIYQIIKGIKFLHSAQIIHRDLKPSNVLLNSDCHLKICDFGLARSLVADKQGTDMVLTEEVATRWYRAPEVLLGSQSYEKSADIWSIGCILGQILIGKPMFPGNSTLNQLQRIISFTGNPSKQDIYSLNSQVAVSMMSSITQFKVKNIKDWFKPDTPQEAINLLLRMLEFNPKKRPTAEQILKHPYLTQFHNPKQQFQSPKVIYPPVSDNKKLNLKQYRQLIYDRIKKIYKNDEDKESSLYPQPQVPSQSISQNQGQSGQKLLSSTHSSHSHSNLHSTPHSSSYNQLNRNSQHKSTAKQRERQRQRQRERERQRERQKDDHVNGNYHDQQKEKDTPIRHSTGKLKTTSYSSSCSSFSQLHNIPNNYNYSSTGGNNNFANNYTSSNPTYQNYYSSINPNPSYPSYPNTHQPQPLISPASQQQESEPSAKIHKKSSLKQILKSKKYKQEVITRISGNSMSTPSTYSSSNQSATAQPISSMNVSSSHNSTNANNGIGVGSGLNASSSTTTQQNYIQKYYKKPGMSATIYKENKIGRQHV